jgi:hypothetical protein
MRALLGALLPFGKAGEKAGEKASETPGRGQSRGRRAIDAVGAQCHGTSSNFHQP